MISASEKCRGRGSYPQEALQIAGFLVAEVEEAVAWVVGVQTQLGAEGTHIATGPHQEGLTASIAELEFALRAGEMHATAAGQRVLEVALGAADAVLRQVFAQSFGLRFRVVGLFPLHEALARDAFVLLLPLSKETNYFIDCYSIIGQEFAAVQLV